MTRFNALKLGLWRKGIHKSMAFVFPKPFPSLNVNTVRCVIVVAFIKQWLFFELDLNNAYFHGDLHEEAYM